MKITVKNNEKAKSPLYNYYHVQTNPGVYKSETHFWGVMKIVSFGNFLVLRLCNRPYVNEPWFEKVPESVKDLNFEKLDEVVNIEI